MADRAITKEASQHHLAWVKGQHSVEGKHQEGGKSPGAENPSLTVGEVSEKPKRGTVDKDLVVFRKNQVNVTKYKDL